MNIYRRQSTNGSRDTAAVNTHKTLVDYETQAWILGNTPLKKENHFRLFKKKAFLKKCVPLGFP